MLKQIFRQNGYARLTAGTVTLALVIFTVLGYQVYLNQTIPTDGYTFNVTEQTATSVQVFPQTLPVMQNIGYLLEITSSEGMLYELSPFYHRDQGILSGQDGNVIIQGVMPLPDKVKNVASMRLSLFDNTSIKNPSTIPFLSGELEGDRVHLTYRVSDFSDAFAQYSLSTPTDNNSLLNERSGLWFGQTIKNTPALSLPVLPDGWMYEGWAIVDGKPLTTGRFTQASGKDSFDGFSASGAASPDFPGEDFLRDPPVGVFPDLVFPVDLAGDEVMITIEPSVNGSDPTGQTPFALQLFRAQIPKLAQAGVLYDLKLTADSFPRATVVIR